MGNIGPHVLKYALGDEATRLISGRNGSTLTRQYPLPASTMPERGEQSGGERP